MTEKQGHRREGIAGFVGVAIGLAAGLVIGAWPTDSNPQEVVYAVTVQGDVECADGQEVMGIYVDAAESEDGFTEVLHANSLNKAHYFYDLPKGGKYKLRVGCGGNRQKWGMVFVSKWLPSEPGQDLVCVRVNTDQSCKER